MMLSGLFLLTTFINSPTIKFSPPISDQTILGTPKRKHAGTNCSKTVEALLSVLAIKYVMSLEYPSIPLCVAIPHLKKRQKSIIFQLKNISSFSYL